jgi:hypothetical protein
MYVNPYQLCGGRVREDVFDWLEAAAVIEQLLSVYLPSHL